jgi:glycosyltransferase involved in cell wall biosynthesis
MSAVRNLVHPSVVRAYLAGSAALTYCLVAGRSGVRDFSRVIVVAALQRHNGIAAGARLQWAALRQLGIDTELVDATPALRNPLYRIKHCPGSAYVFHGAGPHTANLIASVLPHASTAYRIGYWAWELPDPPLDWSGCDRVLDEVWTPSSFSQASLAQLVRCPVRVVPHYIPPQPARKRCETDPFTVIAFADSRSSWSRKNPRGALQAFHAAFQASSDVKLVLKLGGKLEDVRQFESAHRDLLAARNIEILRGYLDESALSKLYRRADVLLSLHRAEGYGLPMAEAMAHGLPVVATGWSGNLDFMDAKNSCLVPYRLVPVNDGSRVYYNGTWAEPDLAAAAQFLRRLETEPEFYASLAAAAHRRADATKPDFPFDLACSRKSGPL